MLYPAFLYLYRYHLASNLDPLLPELVEIVADYILYRKPQPVVLISQIDGIRKVDSLFTSRTKAEAYLSNFVRGLDDWIDAEKYHIHDIDIDLSKPVYILKNFYGEVNGEDPEQWLTDSLKHLANNDSCVPTNENESWIKHYIAEIDPCIN